ncbi:MAG: mechanosensitive ion channel family protein, partial [Candidatus Paceibacteria bacterium]
SLSIFFDRPFRTGDFIEVGNDMGTVKEIGIRSTRIQSLRGEMLIIANKELIDSRILNYREVEFRRISFEFSVPYETPNEVLKEIPDFVNTIVENEEYAQVERTTFASFEDWGLKFITVYYIKSDDYGEYMYAQERINLSIKAELEQRGTKFAYPTYRAYNYTDEPAIASSETQKE